MADRQAPSVSGSAGKTANAYVRNLPRIFDINLQYMPQFAQAMADAQLATSPALSDLQTRLFQAQAPALAQTSRDITAADQRSQAATDLDLIRGTGGETARGAFSLAKEFDPEFFGVRENAARSVNELLQPGLTTGEEEAIARSINRGNVGRGTLNTPSATSTVADAMQFGNAARTRQLQGVQAANSFLPVSRSGFDPTQFAFGRPSINTGVGQFRGTAGADLGPMTPLSTGFLDNVSGFRTAQMNINANRRDALDRFNEVASSLPT